MLLPLARAAAVSTGVRVQRGLVVTEAGDARQLVVAHLVGLKLKTQEAGARVRVRVTGQGCAGLNLTPGQEAVAHR